ncbi:hypothetical protein H4R34_000796 [Dimargaris verticillata]|uniref:ABC transporter domain-containing protein n=1 Tax=Dimargaris verticillata TaxID=2761393 RepID=A0A9W8EF28_9FUNG|nr:hypothetical protein H4R34_000796 [Dimargaris verticillata]
MSDSLKGSGATGSELPPRGLEWHDVEYKITTGSTTWKRRETQVKTIVQGVSGRVAPGEMVAVIGSSGAGKSSLLNALSGRLSTGELQGTILFNGRQRVPSRFKKRVAYVEQDDVHYAQLTVRETIRYAAMLRLAADKYTDAQREAKVDQIIDTLRLNDAANTFIGDTLRPGVSGGERKRASIGVELVTDPEFMFLDEATSGLDSNSALHVCEVVKEVARQRNIGALMSIHQPSAKILNLFDKVILLSKGQTVYYGPVANTLEYFASLGYHCGQYENPADFYLDLMTIDRSSPEVFEHCNARVDDLISRFRHYAIHHPEVCDYHAYPAVPGSTPMPYHLLHHGQPWDNGPVGVKDDQPGTAAPPRDDKVGWALPWAREFAVLAHRCWKTRMRNKFLITITVTQWLALMLLLGFTFFQIADTQGSIQSRMGVLFYLPISLGLGIVMPLLCVFSLEREIMVRERSTGSYRTSSFHLARFVTELPLTLAVITVYLVGVYFLNHLQYNVAKFFIFLGVNLLTTIVAVSMGLAFGATFKNLNVAQLTAALVITVFLLYADNLVSPDDVTPVLSWIRYVSFIKYGYQALSRNEFEGLQFQCPANPSLACFQTGDAVLSSHSLDSLSIQTCTGLLAVLAVAFQLVTYASLRWKNKPRYLWV